MENRLISMVDYLPEHPYSKFLKQPLQKWMFIPCVEDGEVLDAFVHHVDGGFSREYQQAKERCLFDGFEVEQHEENSFSIRCENNIFNVMWNFSDERGWFPARGILTIEDLVKHNLTLTATALKQIEL